MKRQSYLYDTLLALMIGSAVFSLSGRYADYEIPVHAQSTAQSKLSLVLPETSHEGSITSLAYSPDGRMLASSSADTICLWLVDPGITIKTFGHMESVESIDFSPDGKILASGGRDKIIKLWDVASGNEIRRLAGNGQNISDVQFSPDGKLLASASWDKTIKLWDMVTGKELRTISDAEATSIAFSPDGQTIAASGSEGIRIWKVSTGNAIKLLKEHSELADLVRTIAFTADGRTLASGSLDDTIKLWDVETGKELRTLTGHSSAVSSIAFSADGTLMISGSEDKTVRLWDVKTGQEIHTLKDHSQGVTSVAFSPNGKSIASSSKDRTIDIWSVSDGSLQKTLKGHAQALTSVAFSPHSALLASGSDDNTIKLWEMKKGELTRTLSGHTNSVLSVAFSPTGTTLASGSRDNTVRLWDVATGAEVRTLVGHSALVSSVAFSPDGKTVASGSWDKTIKLWNVVSGSELMLLKAHSDRVSSVVFSPDGRTLAAGGYDSITLWDVDSGRKLRTFEDLSSRSVVFSPDGKMLASGNRDNTIKLWDVASGRELNTLKGHFTWVSSVVFTPDGKTLASGSFDQKIKLWDVASGRELETLPGHTAWVNSMTFIGDGQMLASASQDGTIKLWSVPSGKELATLIAVDQKDWIIVDNESRVDASANSQRLMYWLVGDELIDFDQLKQRYYEPGLLVKLLGFRKEPLKDVSKFGNPRLSPGVKYELLTKGGRTLTATLSNRGGGIGRVQVFVNDKEFLADARDEKLKQNPEIERATLNIDLSGATGVVSGKENAVRVVAWNVENYISSRGAELVWTAAGSEDKARPEFYAIVGGISEYADQKLNLRFAAKGADDFSTALELAARGLFGADRVHITLLSTSDNSTAIVPTKENFFKAFDAVARQARPQDILVVYLNGYGVPLQRADGNFGYLTMEARTSDAAELSAPAIRRMAITSDEIAKWISQVPALKTALILDTCAAGAVASSFGPPGELTINQIRAIERLQDKTGFWVLTGSAANQMSYEATQYGQGLLTHALLEGMRGAALRENTFVDVARLFLYAQDRVPYLARAIGGSQTPVIFSQNSSFDIGMLSTEDRAAIPLSVPRPLVLRPTFINDTLAQDDLRITSSVTEALRAESSRKTRKSSGRIVFIDADEMSSAIRPAGIYNVDEGKVKLKLNLVLDNRVISSLNIEGTIKDIKGFMALVTETVIQEVTKANKQPSPEFHHGIASTRFHHQTNNSSPFVVMLPVIHNVSPELGDDLKLKEHVVKALEAWSEDKNDSVPITFKNIDELKGAYKFEGIYERHAKGFLRLSLILRLNGVVVAQPTPSVCDSSDKTRIADLLIEMAHLALSSLPLRRGAEIITAADMKVLNYKLRSYALLIATNDYDEDTGWRHLNNPICDAEAVKKELVEYYGFAEEDVFPAYNQDYDGVWSAIDQYRNKVYPANSDTALFVFIAGHGTYDEQRKKGMLATKNARVGDPKGNNYYRFTNLMDDISTLPFKHIFVVIDACQSGDAINDSTDRGDPDSRSDAEFIIDKLSRATRKAFTSASYNNVSDGIKGQHSPFTEKLLEAFRKYGSNDRFLTIDEMWTLGGMDRLQTNPRRGWFRGNDPGSDFLLIAQPRVKEYKCRAECNCN